MAATFQSGLKRKPNTQAVSWFLDLYSAGKLDLDPPYQRRSVWNVQYQQFFIDSIIRNYPAPTIFLQVEVSTQVATTYHVIDGKQRLTAVLDFVSDKFSTPDSLSDVSLDQLYYSELPDDVKVAILEYTFQVENISSASVAEMNQAFDRLNRNVARLNKQELRHARFDGALLRKVENLVEHPFWSEIGIATPARARRMLDVEYISELYIVAMDGPQDGKDYLDQYYSANDREIISEEAADKRFLAAQDFLRGLNEHVNLRSTRFSNLADFYSLWAAVIEVIDNGESLDTASAAEKISEFATEIEDQETRRASNYMIAAVQGSNKLSNRATRTEFLREVLAGR